MCWVHTRLESRIKAFKPNFIYDGISGRYPLWGGEYLSWWTGEQLLAICGRGIFSSSPWLLCWYVESFVTLVAWYPCLSPL